MADVFTIPLSSESETFEISLNGRAYLMTVRYNDEMPAWTMCMSDALTLEPLITCLPLVAGVDLLDQFNHLGLNASMWIYTDGDENADPTYENLGTVANLYYTAKE